jgi:transcriptional regulator with XRE-family HTH domain
MAAFLVWDTSMGSRFAQVRAFKEDTQKSLAERWSTSDLPITQATISRVERGSKPSRSVIEKIRLYCEEAGCPLDQPITATPAHTDDAEFNRIVESGFGSDRSNIVDSVTRRLANGPAMSEADWQALRLIAKAIGIETP